MGIIAFERQQNIIRGIVAYAKSQRFVKNDNPKKTLQTVRLKIRECYLVARHEIQVNEQLQFLEWARSQLYRMLPELKRSPIGYDSLSGVSEKRQFLDLEREVNWIVSVLCDNADALTHFRKISSQCESMIVVNDIESAISQLQELDSLFGTSLWSVQFRIALEHQAGGLERQKKYTSEVRAIFKVGLLSFLAYHTSVRNEERTTLSRYLEDTASRINRHKFYDQPIRDFLSYKLLGQIPEDSQRQANLLYIAQSHSIIDVYETLISTLQFLACKPLSDYKRSWLARAVARLNETITDFRLLNLSEVIKTKTFEFALPIENVGKLLLDGHVLDATRLAKRNLRLGNTDVWTLLYGGAALAHAERTRTNIAYSPQNILDVVSAVLSNNANNADSLNQAAKLCLNFSFLPSMAGLNTALMQLHPSINNERFRPWAISLNSQARLFNSEGSDSYTVFQILKPNESRECLGISAPLLFSWAFVSAGDFKSALAELENYSMSFNFEPVASIVNMLKLICYWNLGDRESVIRTISARGARGAAFRQMLPVKDALLNYTWEDFRPVAASLAASCALHMLWAVHEQELIATQLRFSVGQLLRLAKLDRPSSIFDNAENYNKSELIYFLRNVCVPNIIDQCRVLKGSKAVKIERQAICAGLRTLDPENSDIYEVEIFEITNQLAMDEGRLLVDRTRIYVDSEALIRWAGRELLEDYQRYRDLLAVNLPSPKEFDEIMRKILLPSSATTNNSFIPEDEAEAILADLLYKLHDEFLNNSSFGLDFYLSKRVRHQSFIGLIRGPLELAELITTRESEAGAYHPNESWVKSFEQVTNGSQQLLYNSFSQFAARFDEILTTARDRMFQIRSKDHPDGLIFLDLPPQFVLLARTIARSDLTVEDFAKTTVSLLWGAIEPSLGIIRSYIIDEMSHKIVSSFNELRASVSDVAEHDPSFLAFKVALNKASEGVQRSLDESANWFLRTDDEIKRKLFTVRQIADIALDAALKCQRGFEPEIDLEVKELNLKLLATSLVFVHDVLFVALDNIRAHSGIRKPKVKINITPDINGGSITVNVVSDFKAPNRASTERKLQEIRQAIDNGTYGRKTKIEGGSGFFKLAAVIKQSEKGHLNFGFTENGNFKMTVTYSMITQQFMEENDEGATS